ncbi:hypothetical membrane protein [Bacteroides ovatus V975]|nr:hypothetical membrane protein [Bacteroides ovatus V975]
MTKCILFLFILYKIDINLITCLLLLDQFEPYS